jgi:tetratricopeptide (TPR) repeat protein
MSASLAEILQRFMDRAKCGPDVLANLTGIHRSTIIHWLNNDVKKPRDWKQLVAMADALRLNIAEATQLLRSAGHCSIEELLVAIAETEDRHLLSRWAATEKQLFATLPLGPVPTPSPLPAGSRMLLSRNPLFVGRASDVQALARMLKEGSAVAVTGIGGIGKTQLVSEFVHRYGQFFHGGVFWLSFAEPSGIPAEIALCGGIGCLELRPNYNTLTLEEQVRLVFAAWQRAVPRLLIFDNCEDEALFSRWRPHTGGCSILLTSRRAYWDRSLGVQSLPLDVLGREDSIALLRMFLPNRSVDDAPLDAVATELGYLPLALHLAGRYLARCSHTISVSTYLSHLRDPGILQHQSMLGGGVSPTDHTQHVARTFELSYYQLDTTDPTDALALAVLSHAAYFAPGELIPQDLLLACVQDGVDLDQVARAIARVIELGLLEVAGQPAFRMHRLLVMFVRHVVPDMTAQAIVERVLLQTAKHLNARGKQEQLLRLQPHVRAVTDAALPRDDELAADLSLELSRHLCAVEEYPEAQRYNQHSLDIRIALLGEEHPGTIDNLHLAGQLLDWQGRYEEAQPYHERALGISKVVLNATHPDLATSFNHVGEILHARCDYSGAKHYYERTLEIRERVFGADHPSIAESLNNIGLLLNAMGYYTDAQPYLERAVAICEATLDIYNPTLALVLNNLGYLLRVQGEYAAAAAYLTQALDLREQIYGLQHTYVAVTLNHLGRLHHYRGDYVQARSYLERMLAIRLQAYRPRHVEIANGLGNLGMLLYDMGDTTSARPYLEQALTIHMQELGEQHRHTARSLNHLGMFLHTEGDIHIARSLLERALSIREQVLGPSHPDTGNSIGNLGMVLCDAGERITAHTLLARALATHRQALGDDHPYTARSYLRMGILLQKQQDFPGARTYVDHALALYERVLGVNHPFTMKCHTHRVAL